MAKPFQCTRCKKRLTQQAVRAAGMQFHTACFVCDLCKKPLQKSFQHKRERLYHPACYHKLFGINCLSCKQAITGAYVKSEAGHYHKDCYKKAHQMVCALCQQDIEGTYLESKVWKQKAHTEHAGVKTMSCHVCARLGNPQHARQAKVLADRRMVCGVCQTTEIETPPQIQTAKIEALNLLRAVGFDYIPDYVKIEMYAEQALINERMQASATGNIHGYTRTAQRNIPNYGLILEHSIHILNGMPRLAFMGVLAHELLHVWVNERNLKHLQPLHVEGFCNLATALMYKQAATASEQELAQVLLQRMQEDLDPVYGDGYRLMKAELEQKGWPTLLKTLEDPSYAPRLAPIASSPPQSLSRTNVKTPLKTPTKPGASKSTTRQATSSEDSARRLAEIKARVQAKMKGARPNNQTAPKKGLKKLGKKKRK